MKNLLVLLFVLTSFSGIAQDLEYRFLFEGIGDNREYFNPVAYPHTILGTRAAAEIGVEKNGHRLRGGLNYLYEFGSKLDFNPIKLTLYYQFANQNTEFLFGAFPRRGKINFPLAMLTDTLMYYRPNIEGLFGEIHWDWGKQNTFVDWVSRQTNVNREQFMAGSSGEFSHKNLFLQNYILMYHDAKPAMRIPGDHIKDYFGYSIQAGIRTLENSKFTGEIKAGVLSSMFRDRGIADGFITAGSFYAETNGRYKNVGLKSVLSSGASHKFAFGDLFYQAKNYWRTDLFWYFFNQEKIKGTFNLSFHVIDWSDLDQQQQLSLIYVFGN